MKLRRKCFGPRFIDEVGQPGVAALCTPHFSSKLQVNSPSVVYHGQSVVVPKKNHKDVAADAKDAVKFQGI